MHHRHDLLTILAVAVALGVAACQCEQQPGAADRADGSRAQDAASGPMDDGGPTLRADGAPASDGGVGGGADADRGEPAIPPAADGGGPAEGDAAARPGPPDAATSASGPGRDVDAGPSGREPSPGSDAGPRPGAASGTDAGGGPRAEATDAGDGTDAEATRVAGLVQRRYGDARSFEADFEQTYRNRLLGRTQKSSGHVWLRPPDRMRWEYAPPSKNLIVADGTHLFVYEPEPNQVVRMPVSGSELPSVMAFLTGGRDLGEDYQVRTVHDDQLQARGQAGLELRPRRPSSVVARVVLVVARAAGDVLRTVLVDPEGNTNTFVWSDVRTDRALPDSRFLFTPPTGARVVER